jgi:hypothetical protein
MTTATQADTLTLTIAAILPSEWYAGMLMDKFEFTDGTTGRCNCILYRIKMLSTSVTVYGHGRRGFAFASKPVGWSPKVGDQISIHPSQI